MRQKISSQVGNQLLRGSGGNTWQDRGAQQAGAVMTLNPYYQNNWFARWQEWARWYFTSWEARKIVEIPVDDALRVPFEITGIDEKYAELLWDGMKKLDFLNKIKRIAIQERMLGGCVGIMGIRSEHAHTDDPSLPLDLNEIDFNDFYFKNEIEIRKQPKYDFILVNYSNPDMIGHTGNFESTKEAIKCVEKQAYALALATIMAGGDCIITADHGNADHAVNDDGTPNTAHSLNPVPCIWVTDQQGKKLHDGVLADVAPTILQIMGIPQPVEMTGKSLIG